MKTRRLLPLLLLVLTIPALPVIAQVPSPQYLGHLPSWERIKAQVKGKDAMDTAARQMGTCWQLRQVVYDLAWTTQRRGRNRLTLDETRLVSDYDTGYFLASQPYLPIQNTPSHPEWKKWHELHSFYEGDEEFLDALLTKLTPAEFRTAYYKAMGKQPPAPVASGAEPSARPKSQPSAPSSTPAAGKPSQLMAYVNEGQQFYKAKDYERALESYKQALTQQCY